VGVDTAPLIYYIEEHPRYVEVVQVLIELLDQGGLQAYSSVITLTEVLSLPKQLGQTELQDQYKHLLLHGRNFTLVPIDTDIAEHAAELRARFGLRTPDALQIASVLSVDCTVLVTNDRKLRTVTDLEILVLDALLD
jgi:predicted nucleic acid-binding protein